MQNRWPNFPYIVYIDPPNNNNEFLFWLIDNIPYGTYIFDRSYNPPRLKYGFKDEIDAIAFKLRWL